MVPAFNNSDVLPDRGTKDLGQNNLARTISRQPRRVLVISASYPSQASPLRGIFVQQRVAALAKLPGYEVRVIAPLPHFPGSRWLTRWPAPSAAPLHELVGATTVYRPRFLYVPRIGAYFRARLMLASIMKVAEKLRREFEFDLIDAHFAYPAGVVASELGKHFNKPVVITGRGEDMLRFPQLPMLGRQIRAAMTTRPHLIALSDEIAQAFIQCGADSNRVSLIPNGIDGQKFRMFKMDEARRQLQLPLDARIVLSVGDMQERKGFHILVEAFAQVRERAPNTILVIVGGPAPYGKDYTAVIKQKIVDLRLQNCVRLVGKVAHEQLPLWYSSADVFALLSSREGSCNVVLESLACGAPVVMTDTGDIPTGIRSGECGQVVNERTAAATSACLANVMSRQWDRQLIRQCIATRTWDSVAEQVDFVFTQAIDEHRNSLCPGSERISS